MFTSMYMDVASITVTGYIHVHNMVCSSVKLNRVLKRVEHCITILSEECTTNFIVHETIRNKMVLVAVAL